MAQIKTKFIEADAINDTKVKLSNDAFLRGRNAGDSADVNIIKVNASDALELALKLNDPSDAAPTVDTQLANKKYVDDSISGLPSPWNRKGNWDASSNTPTLVASTGTDGDLYIVTVAGSTSLDGISSWGQGDWIYFANGVWNKADNVDDVVSVAGKTGAVTLDTDDVTEATALYFTDTRARTAVITQVITDGVTDRSPSEDAVFDALALKAVDADVVKKAGSTMDSAANLTFAGGGEVLGLPASPSVDGAAASKKYVDDQISGATGSSQGQEVITLAGGDITAQKVTLAQSPLAASTTLSVSGVEQTPTTDFTIATNELSFAGGLATGGASELIAGDILVINYEY